tara:strand:- start:106232 stop:107047 length:816 start_codon:yes stop_codon:yes gene_type:complete
VSKKDEIKTLSGLEHYVDAELDKITQIKRLQEKMEAYQVLEAFANKTYKDEIELLETTEDEIDNDLPSWQMLWADPIHAVTSAVALILTMPTMLPDQFNQMEESIDDRSQALLNKIGEAKNKSLRYGLIPILEQLQRSSQAFHEHLARCSRIKKHPEIQAYITQFDSDLNNATRILQETGNLEQFRFDVNQAFKMFPHEVKLEINGTRTWFQINVLRPFEQFKEDVRVLFESILKKTPEHSVDSPRLFKKNFEAYEKDLKELADYEPPKPK